MSAGLFHSLLSLAAPDNETLLFGSDLSSQPADWADTAEFTFTGGVLNSTGTSANTGWDSFAGWSYLSSQERQRIKVEFNINSTTSVFRVLKYNSNTWSKSGSVAEVDFENSLLKLYNAYSYPTIPTVLQQTAITVTINTAHDYTLTFSKRDLQTVITLTNVTTGQTTTITRNQSGSGVTEGIFRGQVALMHVKGDIDFTGLNYYALNLAASRVAMYGDSYIDGYSLSDDLTSRWTYQAYNHQSGNALISGWGGNSSADLLTRSKDWENILPKNVIISVGYNEAILATWKNNLESLIRVFVLKGSNVILTTYAPLTTVLGSSNIDEMNAYVLARGYQVIDISAMLTVGGDRVTLDTSLILPDDTHPNTDGHDAIYGEYLTLSLYDTQRLNNGIISYFKFDSNANDSTGLHNGTLGGSPSSVAGIINNCYQFAGPTKYISLADSNLLSFVSTTDTELTFSVWIYVTSLGATNYIFTKRASSLEYQLVITTLGAVGLALFSAGAGTATLNKLTANGSIVINTWYHVVATYDGSETSAGIKIYINAVSMALTDASVGVYLGMNNTTSNAYIGAINTTVGGFVGKIDELGIWRRKLEAVDVTALYNSGAALAYENFISNP